MYIAGIDEAGRGPVLGPLVMAICAMQPGEEKILEQWRVRDSKQVPKPERAELFVKIGAQFAHEIIALDASEVDAAVQGRSDNLNRLEARTSARLVWELAQRIPLSRVIIDSPQVSCDKYEALVRAALEKLDTKGVTKKIVLQCEIKADVNHRIVGAASILAKVTRDAAISELEKTHGPLGNGYMTDPLTQEFLSKHWQDGHAFFRKSWESYRRMVDGAAQTSLGSFEAHKEEVAEFEALREHGFVFKEPSNPYEVVRMQNPTTRVSVIKYTTGKMVVQGPAKEKEATLALLRELGL